MGETDGGAKAITWPAGACNGEEEHDVVLTAEKVLLLRTNATVTRARRHEMCSGLCDGRLARILSVAWFMAGLSGGSGCDEGLPAVSVTACMQ